MAFNNNFVFAVKCGNKVLREVGGGVYLPFGSEYSILMKNLDSRKAVVSIDVDGESVSEHKFIIDGNNSLELKGFEKGNTVTNAFKFIEKTEKISNYRGDKVDDGYIRVEVTFEKHVEEKLPLYLTDVYKWYSPYTYNEPNPLTHRNVCYSNSNMTDQNCTYEYTYDSYGPTPIAYMSNTSCQSKSIDEGITVKGSKQVQDFVTGTTKELEAESSIFTIYLKGYRNVSKKVKAPITTSDKVKCSTCGTNQKSSSKFCHECGTCLY